MADLKTTYMGIPLANPLVVGACSLSKNVDSIKALEAAGAGGLVIKSLFEEQIQIEEEDFASKLGAHDNADPEAQSFFPKLRHGGPKEHIFWVKEARKAVKFPLFASLNCINSATWVEYAKQLADTGVNGLELNFYSPALSPDVLSGDIEKKEAEALAKVRAVVKLPIAVKLHPYYTSLMNVAASFEKAGANALILFNPCSSRTSTPTRLPRRPASAPASRTIRSWPCAGSGFWPSEARLTSWAAPAYAAARTSPASSWPAPTPCRP